MLAANLPNVLKCRVYSPSLRSRIYNHARMEDQEVRFFYHPGVGGPSLGLCFSPATSSRHFFQTFAHACVAFTSNVNNAWKWQEATGEPQIHRRCHGLEDVNGCSPTAIDAGLSSFGVSPMAFDFSLRMARS